MKLNYKIYFPFFTIIALLFIFSCDREKENFISRSSLNKEDSIKLSGYQNRAENFRKTHIQDSAFKYFNECRQLQLKVNDSLAGGHSLLRMAEIQMAEGDDFGCEENATEAMALLENLQYNKNISIAKKITYLKYRQKYLCEAYNLLGRCYKNLTNTNRAIELYNKAKSVTKDSLDICIIENNKAGVYIENNEYNKAYLTLQHLIISNVVLNHPETKARVLNNLGRVSNTLNKPNALNYLETSLEIRILNNDLPGIVSSYIQLAKYYTDKNKSKALQYSRKAYVLATKMKNSDKRLEALTILIRIAPDKEQEALLYIKINDSLKETRLKTKTEFASIKYEAAKNEAKIAKLEKDNAERMLKAEQDATSKLLLRIAILCALIVSIFIIYILRLRHKKAKIIEAYNTENRISKKIHDELANDVFNVMSFAESQETTNPGQTKLLHDLDVIYQKTRDISRENNTIDTGENFDNILREMLADFKTQSINVITINFDSIAWNKIADHKKITVYRVLQELMVNMKKHSQADMVAIKFSCDHKKVTIHYKDNGKGLGSDKLLYKNGLKNAENRISAINGSFIFDTSTTGLKVICTFPA